MFRTFAGPPAIGHQARRDCFAAVRTVESHRAHIQQKIGLTTRAELVAYARQRGLLD